MEKVIFRGTHEALQAFYELGIEKEMVVSEKEIKSEDYVNFYDYLKEKGFLEKDDDYYASKTFKLIVKFIGKFSTLENDRDIINDRVFLYVKEKKEPTLFSRLPVESL